MPVTIYNPFVQQRFKRAGNSCLSVDRWRRRAGYVPWNVLAGGDDNDVADGACNGVTIPSSSSVLSALATAACPLIVGLVTPGTLLGTSLPVAMTMMSWMAAFIL
jgi:hypothetical protein